MGRGRGGCRHPYRFARKKNRHQIQIVAEAVTGVDDKLEAFRSEVAVGFESVHELLRASHLDLDRRVTRLEEGRSS